RKGFEKHGVLANPYSFGFFEAMRHNKAQRFSHTFVINEADGLPAPYRGKLFAVEPLQGRVMLCDIKADRSSFETRDLGPDVRSRPSGPGRSGSSRTRAGSGASFTPGFSFLRAPSPTSMFGVSGPAAAGGCRRRKACPLSRSCWRMMRTPTTFMCRSCSGGRS